MKKTLITMGWAFAAMLLLAACHGMNQGETVSVPPGQPSVTTGAPTTTTTATEEENEAAYQAIKGLVITRTENGVKKVQTMNFAFKDDGRLGAITSQQVRGTEDFGGNDITLEYDDQGKLKSLFQKLVPPQVPPQNYNPHPENSYKFDYNGEGRLQSIAVSEPVGNNFMKLFGTWAFTYASKGAGIERTGIFTFNNPTEPKLKSVALFDLKGNLTNISFSVEKAAPNILFEREIFYTPEGALKGITEKQYDTVTFKLVFTNLIEISYKSPGVPEKLTINRTDLNNKSYLDLYTVKGYEGDQITQAVFEESLDNGKTFNTIEEITATSQPLKVQPIVDVGMMLNNHYKSLVEFAQALLVFANHPEIVMGKL